jgi:hypothetical protein
MEQANPNTMMRQFKRAFTETELNDLGKRTGFCQRMREVTPYRLSLGMLDVFSNNKVITIADMQRGFNALCKKRVQYKPFHNQLAKPSFPVFMQGLFEHLMCRLTQEVLRFDTGSPFARFQQLWLHDGSSFGLKSSLREVFPGRFTATSPAGVELHVTMGLLDESIETVVLTADSEAEVHHAPAPASLRGGLLLADRMFFIKAYLAEVEACGGAYIVKAKGTVNPVIRHAYRADGKELKGWRGLQLKAVKRRIAQYGVLDVDVSWPLPEGGMLAARLIVSRAPEGKTLRYLVTNLERTCFTAEDIMEAYRLRWQIELLFKEWKSHANLHAFDTSNPAIAEGLIWMSLCAALLKRYCAQMAQQRWVVPISTQKVAMCLRHVLTDVFRALLHAPRRFASTMRRALEYLADNAQRAHPKRDKRKGRLKLGLEHVYFSA